MLSMAPATPEPPTASRDLWDSERDDELSRQSFVLPCADSMLPAIRYAVRGALNDFPRWRDAELIASEFASTAVHDRHDDPRLGGLSIVIVRYPGCVRLEVSYYVNPEARPGWDAEAVEAFGLGLTIIRECSDRWGHGRYTRWDHSGVIEDRQTWYAELTCTESRDADSCARRA